MIEVANDEDARRPALLLRAHLPDVDGLVHVVAQVRRLFDLDADPDAVDTHLARDPLLRPLVRANRGLRVPGTVDPLEIGVRAILGQQVSVAQATRLSGRLVAALRRGRPRHRRRSGWARLFPTAATLRDAPLDDIGITTTRADAIRAFAAATVPLDGSIELDDLVRELRSLRGVGEWTAQYVAMRGAGERDAFPAADLGLRHALGGSRADALARGRPPGTRGGPTRRCTCGARPRRHRHRPVRPHDLYLPRS